MSDCSFCGTPFAPGTATCPRCGNPSSGVRQPAAVVKGPSSRLPLFLMVGGFFLVATFFIPHFMDALQKAKQKRTVADPRRVETASVPDAVGNSGTLPPGQSPRAIRPARAVVFEPADVPEYEEGTFETTTADWILELEDGFLLQPADSAGRR